MNICEYGCGQEAKYQFKNGKWCCSKSHTQCPEKRMENLLRTKKLWRKSNSRLNSISRGEKISETLKKRWKDLSSGYNSVSCREKRKKRMKDIWKDPTSIFNSISRREKLSNKLKKSWKNCNSRFNSVSYKNERKVTIIQIKNRYPFFSQIEEMRYNPNKPGEKEIQVHCKNHLCPNSKEQNGWFTPTYIQLYERIRQLENEDGNGGSHFYCSDECKKQCPLFNLKFDPLKEIENPYTQEEYQLFRQVVLERENYICEYCGEKAVHVHHEKPQKLEQIFSLDPDNGIACCEECHYKYGHKTGTECSTGNLAAKVCFKGVNND